MSADLFGSFAEATCAALVIGSNSIESADGSLHIDQLIFVLAIPAVGILACIIVSYLITEGNEIQQGV
jgi:inorganic pyrophosphatase